MFLSPLFRDLHCSAETADIMPHHSNMTPCGDSYKGKAGRRAMYFKPAICHNGLVAVLVGVASSRRHVGAAGGSYLREAIGL